jgi:heme A synthase
VQRRAEAPVLALAVLDAAVGVYVVVHELLSGKIGGRYVGAVLVLCAAALLALPSATAEPEHRLPLSQRF